ncbi:hypothetical protein P154DRAFT_134570 [Amniculicola lignicola CBS 123094]|uniref:Uncharacterized protein n=1 Tax=Amniculicola lignicola CBS 123094 TaxID=1392246 RepID=A0A6A5WL51_9PLEO|nr:hypothetical protein P154DRAFT_134570 [Amniculicola lignicola CBS 123094]
MFSPEAASQSARSSLRNPRRRQRKDSDSLQHQTRRKRSKLSDDTFVATADALANGNGNGSVLMNGYAGQSDVDGSLVLVDMPYRDKKQSAKRAVKEDLAVYLTRNENYSVKKLPNFPGILSNTTTPFRAFALPSAGLALALTSEHALAWDYTSPSGPSRIITLPLPFGLRSSDPLPLGAIVRNGPTNDFGILAIAPSSGKVTFWDNVDSAQARSHLPQRHQGVNDIIKMYSGEVITGVVDIEHAGYILVFSTGRLAQLTLRDGQGRPSISVSNLQAPTASNGSFFSFRGLLGGAIRKPIAAIQARPSESKGQMEVITATDNGVFHIWDLSWSGQHIFKQEINVHDEVVSAISQNVPAESRGSVDARILDFAIMESDYPQGTLNALVLVALHGFSEVEYSLLEVDLEGSLGSVSRNIPIRNFTQTQVSQEPSGSLHLPSPGHTAFVQLPGAIVVASLAKPEDGPNAQLLSDSGGAPSLPFQDTIYFLEDKDVKIVGNALENTTKKDRQASALFVLQGYGAIQVSAVPPSDDEGDEGRHRVTALSKLEQATLFSEVAGNILDFSVSSRFVFADQDIEEAAAIVSSRILSSSYEQLAQVTSKMEDHMTIQGSYLRNLNKHLRKEYRPLSFLGRWNLLTCAEKLASALAIWNQYEKTVSDQKKHPESYPDALLLPALIRMVTEKTKHLIRTEIGENDPLRQYFTRDVSSLDILIPMAWSHLRMFYLNDKQKSRPILMQKINEADDIMLLGLRTAFDFRIKNIAEFGIDPTSIRDGVLLPNRGYYEQVENMWTSTYNIVSSIRGLVDASRHLAEESFEQGIGEDLAKKIATDNPGLVKVCCQTHIERYQRLLEQPDEKRQQSGFSLRADYLKQVRSSQIFKLVDIGMATEGMELAETYDDMETLAHLVHEEHRFMAENREAAISKMDIATSQVKLNQIKERIQGYFDRYGDAWATAYYSRYITERQSGHLLSKEHFGRPAFTKFWRSDASLGRLGWINEVIGEKNYEAAGRTLLEVATKQEQNSWCSKTQLSIAKLALLCGTQSQTATTPALEVEQEPAHTTPLTATVRHLEYANVQQQVYERFAPFITTALDDNAAVELLMAEFGQGRLADRPAHQQLLKQAFENLVHNRVMEPALLVDLLTLVNYVDTDGDDQDSPIKSNECAFALKALALSWDTMDKTLRESTLRTAWKRICIKDNWAEINDTNDVTDAQLTEFLAETCFGWTFKSLLHLTGMSFSPYGLNSIRLTGLSELQAVYHVVFPPNLGELLGAGCKNSELCTRFGSEDLRRPIIADNLTDDEVFRKYITKHRLDAWIHAAVDAAKLRHEQDKEELEEDEEDDMIMDYDDGSVSVEEVEVPQTADVNLEEELEESSVADQEEENGADDDVIMLDD